MSEVKSSKINHGLNLKRIRSACQLKQGVLAEFMGVDQRTISYYENQEILSDEILHKFAHFFKIPVAILKNMPDDTFAPMNYFQDVTFNNSPFISGSNSTVNNNYNTSTSAKERDDLK